MWWSIGCISIRRPFVDIKAGGDERMRSIAGNCICLTKLRIRNGAVERWGDDDDDTYPAVYDTANNFLVGIASKRGVSKLGLHRECDLVKPFEQLILLASADIRKLGCMLQFMTRNLVSKSAITCHTHSMCINEAWHNELARMKCN